MAIPLNFDPLLPVVQADSDPHLQQKYAHLQTRQFSSILEEAFLNGACDSRLAATVESLVVSLMHRMASCRPACKTLNATVVDIPRLAYTRTADSAFEPAQKSDASKKCLQTDSKSDIQTDLNDLIEKASSVHQVDAGLVSAVIRAESNFDPSSVSSKGAMGLMQLMPETARELGVENPHDPEENIMGGVRYLRMLLDRYAGDVRNALAAYNWGMGNLERNPGRLPRETRGYIARVMKYYEGVSV